MKWIVSLLWLIFGQVAKRQMRRSLARQLKERGVTAYLRALMGARRLFLAALLVFFFLQVTLFAGVGALVTGLWLWEYDPHAKMQLAFGLCLGLFLIPVLLIAAAFSERLWYRFSGAEKMVDEILAEKHSTSDAA